MLLRLRIKIILSYTKIYKINYISVNRFLLTKEEVLRLNIIVVMGGKRPANEYAFAPMYRIRKVEKGSVGVLLRTVLILCATSTLAFRASLK